MATNTVNPLTAAATTAPIVSMALCPLHPAYEADYCPACGTSTVIGHR